MDDLATSISKKKERYSWSNSRIISIADLREIWTNDALENIVQGSLKQDQIMFAKEHLIRTISLLVYIRAPDVGQIILSLIESQEFWDQKLHDIDASKVDFSLGEKETHFFDARPWFIAPILTEGGDMVLERGQDMPLVGMEELGQGMNGVVTGHMIVRGHLMGRNGLANSREIAVAKKTFQGNSPDAQREIDILKRLRDLLHNEDTQICPCLVTVTKLHEVHSLSLRAGKNLRHKLQEMKTQYSSFNLNYLMASIKQIEGIIGALKFLHNTQSNGPDTCYCHMDIKPENIVVFESDPPSDVGEWRLIDFGITTISNKRSRKTHGGAREEGGGQHITITVGTHARAIASRYQPPEINSNIERLEKKESGKYMGRGSDIWSLACVFAEVVAANLGQLDDLDNNIPVHSHFYEKAKAPWIFRGHRRHPYFDEWLKRLQRQGRSEPALKICHELIVEMTEIRRIRRLKSQQVLEKLRKFLDLSEQHSGNVTH